MHLRPILFCVLSRARSTFDIRAELAVHGPQAATRRGQQHDPTTVHAVYGVPLPAALSPSLNHVVDAALGDLILSLLLGAPRRVGDLADARVALALA